MPEELKQIVKGIRSEVKFPVWYFSGLVLIGIFIGFMAYADGRDDKLEAEYLTIPQVGDVYNYKIDKSENYVDSMQFMVAKENVMNLYTEGDIFDISRD